MAQNKKSWDSTGILIYILFIIISLWYFFTDDTLEKAQQKRLKEYTLICYEDSLAGILEKCKFDRGYTYVIVDGKKYRLLQPENSKGHYLGSGTYIGSLKPQVGDSIYKYPNSNSVYIFYKKGVIKREGYTTNGCPECCSK